MPRWLRSPTSEATTASNPPRSESQELQRLHSALDALSTGVVICDDSGEVVSRNQKAASLVGDYQTDALLKAAVEGVIAKAVDGEYGRELIDVRYPAPGTFVIKAEPIDDDGMVVLIEDVSERARVDAIRRDFAANVSHELRTPIGALILLSETLMDERDPDAILRINGHIASEAKRAGRLVDGLLNLSRIEADAPSEKAEVHLGAAIADALNRERPIAEKRSIALCVEGDPGETTLGGDHDELVSAVANLVENAVKYSDPGSDVVIRTDVDGASARVSVIDQGIGIPATDLDRIFERFYRVDKARSRDTGGAGLGLSIVSHVVINHGGRVSVQSREGEGSTFTLTFPLSS